MNGKQHVPEISIQYLKEAYQHPLSKSFIRKYTSQSRYVKNNSSSSDISIAYVEIEWFVLINLVSIGTRDLAWEYETICDFLTTFMEEKNLPLCIYLDFNALLLYCLENMSLNKNKIDRRSFKSIG